MFKISSLGPNNSVQIVDAAMAIVSDRHGNPLAIVQALGPDETTIVLASDPDFSLKLKQLGINRTVLVDHFEQPKL